MAQGRRAIVGDGFGGSALVRSNRVASGLGCVARTGRAARLAAIHAGAAPVVVAIVVLGCVTESLAIAADRPASGLAAPVIIRDGGIDAVLPGAGAGDPARGRAIVASRQVGLCLLCHPAPIPEERFQGDLATDLAGVGQRATAAQLRLRIVDASRLNPETIMPSYFRVDGLNRVAPAVRGKPMLHAQQIEDVVAWLLTLREPPQERPSQERPSQERPSQERPSQERSSQERSLRDRTPWLE